LLEWGAIEEEKKEKNRGVCLLEEQEEIVEEVDEGELLVLTRASSGLKGAKEEQRENIFHSRCTI